jgi:hypothetical protein
MQHLEVSGAVVLYIGRTVSKGYTTSPPAQHNGRKKKKGFSPSKSPFN